MNGKLDNIVITSDVYEKIRSTIGTLPPEQGALLGSSDGGRTIDHFFWDKHALKSTATYSPNIEVINEDLLPKWNKNDVRLVGIAHSHPKSFIRPSWGDRIYVREILKALGDEYFCLPIIESSASGVFAIHGYHAKLNKYDDVDLISCGIDIKSPIVAESANDFHSRVEKVYPLSVMRKKTIIVVGCGGAGEFIETIARTGIGRIILIDGDTYSETNIATQNAYRSEIGINKASALAHRIHDIDPEIQVDVIQKFLDDATSDKDFEKIVDFQIFSRPSDILIAACTDNFMAQARVASLALKYGMPFLAAQLYEAGEASEIIFTYPGVTPACPRCLLSSRYDEYLKKGFKNNVGSHQTPIFATQRTNALKGFISLMLLLYHEVPGNPYYSMLDNVKTRNFVQIRMSDHFSSPIFEREIGKSPYAFFDEALWITQTPDDGKNGASLCPECGGSGDLRLLKGKNFDTRKVSV
ncbi:MAG: ThiF family adenylyltransferase [Holosporaceae bacterium]|jgi:hypothetical protein|nr:ThiF family adenylyltransferase [Holosporaceae bacterium]